MLTSSTILGDNTSARVVINGVEMDAQDSRQRSAQRPGHAAGRLRRQPRRCRWRTSSDLKTGDGVMTIGYPLNLPVAPSQGPVSGFDASYLTSSTATRQGSWPRWSASPPPTSTPTSPISPGQVGGPLLNSHGEVVGLVATSPDDGRSIYALPVEAMEKIMADFNQYGRARHGWVGVNVMEAPDTEHDGRTVRVVQVVPGTPASESGIRAGDTVMRIDSREIYRPADVLDASFFSQVGANMNVVVRRDDKLFNYTFAVIERPQNPSAMPSPVAGNPAAGQSRGCGSQPIDAPDIDHRCLL